MPADFKIGGFTALINPEKISIQRKVKYEDKNTSASHIIIPKEYKGLAQDVISFDLILDGTGLFGQTTVKAQIDQINTECYNPEGSEHKPKDAPIVFGPFSFKCRLESLTYDLQLFDINGNCIRAKASFQFTTYSKDEAEIQANKFNSPDMSHIVTLRVGDAITNFSHEIYADFRYYTQLAKVNNLTNFRKLKIGSTFIVPPLIDN